MIRCIPLLLLATGLGVAALPTLAQSAETQQHGRKAAKPRKPTGQASAPTGRGINAPSTDFSTIERADEEPRGSDGPGLRPAMGAGGMGVGGSF